MNNIQILDIPKSSKILVTGHVNPDGDALGSGLAMKLVLDNLGYFTSISFDYINKISEDLSFLPIEHLTTFDSINENYDLSIVFDCGDPKRLGKLEHKVLESKSIYIIDHHLEQSFGTHFEIDSNAASTTQVLYRMFIKEKLLINPLIATCLLTGLITDTGRFQYSNTSSEVFDIASALLELGADLTLITESIYGSVNSGALQLQAEVIQRLAIISEVKLSYSYVLHEDYTKHKTIPEETDFLIDVVRLPKETNVAILLKEQEDGTYKGSLRSRGGIDVQAVASLFNGGGHKAAAGFNTDLKPDEILDKVSNAIRSQS